VFRVQLSLKSPPISLPLSLCAIIAAQWSSAKSGRLPPFMSTETNKTNYQSIRTATPSPPPASMHQPQHHLLSEDGSPAGATSSVHPSRQLFYRQADRIPDLSLESRNSHLFGATSSESSVGDVAHSHSEQQQETVIPATSGLPSPEQLHADYSYRLHRAHVRAGHRNIVVGGTHGRYRDFNGTLVEVPEEVFAVRKAALTVFYPLTFCWVSSS
jgi:hypothetical protein